MTSPIDKIVHSGADAVGESLHAYAAGGCLKTRTPFQDGVSGFWAAIRRGKLHTCLMSLCRMGDHHCRRVFRL